MKLTRNIIAIFLSILTLFSICSTSTTVFAAEYTEQKARTEYFDSALSGYLKNIIDTEDAVGISEKEQVDEVVEEVNSSVTRTASTFSLRATPAQSTETAKEAAEDLDIDHTRLTLELEDGENVAYLFSEPVSFIDDAGNLVYKDTNIRAVTDTTIINRGYSYENGDNDYKAYFSEDSSKGLLLVEKDGEEIRLIPNGTQAVGTVGQIESDMELVDSFEYAGVYGTDSVLRFLPQLNGCKEEIVLSSYQGISDFSFTLYTQEGTIAAINSKGEVEIIDSATKDIITTFVAPFANDSSGGMDVTSEHYTDCTYELEMISESKYTLTISVPEEYLESENTVYPVVIDPTTDNISMTYDTSVYSALKDSPQSSNPSACFGKTGSSEYGKGRAMFYFKIPSDIEKYAKISAAKLWLREVTGRTDTMYVRPYLIKESWSNSVTWSTQPAYYSTCSYPTKSDLSLPRRNINSASTDDEDVPYWYAFNIIYAVKAWTTGTTNRGLMFIAECEASDGDYLWRGFATKEYTTSSYRPYAVIKYTNDTTPPTIESIKPNTEKWTNEAVRLTVTASDNVYEEGGISKYSFFYSDDTWQTKKYKDFTENRKVYVRVKDLAGNISERKSYTITNYDPEKPKATITLSPTSWTNGNVTATIKMTDNAAIAKYTINGTTTTLDADGSECITSKTVTKTFSANSTVSVSVTDAAGNTCSTVSKSFTNIDKTKPSATITLSPTTPTKGNVTATIKMTDNAALYSYILDGSDAVSISGTSKTITKTYSKNQTISLTVKDAAGNSYTTTKDITNIDKTKPSVTITLSPTSWTNGNVTATIKMTDNVGLKSYSLDGAAAVSISGTSKTITKSYAANATINITVTDTAGNSVSASKSFANIDKTKPSATITLSPASWTNGNVTATIKMTDNAALDNYVLDGASAVTISGTSKTITKTYSENQKISLTVTDAAGNTYSITKDINNIDKTKPSATITLDTDTWTSNVTATIKMTDNAAIAQYTIDGTTTILDADGSECITSKTITKNYSSNQTISLTVTDAAGNPYSVTKVISNIDDVLPLAEIAINPTDWTSGDVEAMITLSDNVALKSYKLGNEDEVITDGTTKTISKTYSENDTIIVEVKDAVGNTFTERKEITNIDKNAPNVVVSSETTSVSSKITVNASDAGAGLHETAYCYNDGDWTSDNFLYVTDSTEVTIKVRDVLGNTFTTTHTLEEKPEINVTIEPLEWTSDDVIVNVNGTGLAKYSLDNGESWQVENALMVCENKNITVNVTDIFGSTMCVGNYEISNIDKSAPEITDVNVSEITWTYKPVTVTVTAIDEDSGISEYSFDGGESWQIENIKTFNKNEDEIYPETVLVMVKDTAGNTTQWDEISLVPVDVEVPASPDLYEQDGLVYISSRSFDFNEDTDSAEYVEYSLDGTNWSSYEEPLNIVRTYGATVYARVVDAAHNGEDGSNVTSITLENNLGEYTASYTDIALGEGLFPVEFGRTYTSTKGWFFTFDANVAEIDEKTYVFTDFYGEKQYFIKNSEGKYLSVDEEELTVNADSYVLTYGDMTCTFDLLDGKINRITTDYLDTQYTWTDNSLTITGGATVSFGGGKPTGIEIERENKKKTIEYNWTTEKILETDEAGNPTEKEIIRLTSFKDAAGEVHTYNYLGETELLTTNDTETITYYGNRVSMISQPNGAFVKYIYKDKKAEEDSDDTVKAVIVSDSKGVTDTISYSDGVYISSSLDSYSDKASYDSSKAGFKKILDATQDADNIDKELVYVVEEQETGNNQNGEGTGTGESTPGDEPESDGETATDNDIGEETNGSAPDTDGDTPTDNEAGDTDEGTENGTELGGDNNSATELETPLYKEIDENSYVFYTYDEQKRVTVELEVLKANITIDENTTFKSAQAVAESKVTYVYFGDDSKKIAEEVYYSKVGDEYKPTEKYTYAYTEAGILNIEKYYEADVNYNLRLNYIFTYDSNENIVSEQYYRQETENETTVDVEYKNCTRVYEGENLLSETQETLVDGVLTTTKKLSYEYDIGDQLTSYTVEEYTMGDLRLVSSESYNYNNFGNLEKEIIEEYTYVLNSNTNEYEEVLNTIETTYAYDIWNQQINITVKKTGEADLTTVITYDELGNTSTVTEDGVAVAYTYSNGNVSTITETKELQQENGTKVTKTVTSVYGYTDGNLVSRTNTTKVDEVVTETTVATYKYDDYGNLAYHEFNGCAFTYNTLGNILTAKAAVKEENGIETSVDIVSYTYSNDIKQDVLNSTFGNDQIIAYEYNPDGENIAIKLNADADPKYEYKYSSEEQKASEDEATTEEEDTLTANLEGEWVKINDKVSGLFKVIQENKTSVYDSDKAFVYSVETSSKDADDANSFDGTVTTIGGNVYTLVTEENEDTFKTNDIVDFSKKYVYNEEESELERTLTSNVFYTDYGYGNDGVKFIENVFEEDEYGEITEGYIFSYGYENENISSESLTVKSKAENGTSVTVDEAVNYEYDDNDQLTKATSGTTEWTYVYDGRGNIIEKRIDDLSDTAGPVTYTYNYDGKWQDRLISYNGQEIKYALEDGTTDNSNPLVYRGNALTWTMGRQLASFGNISYTYNEEGIRTSKTAINVRTTFLLDGYNVIEQTDGTTTLHFFYDSNGEVIGFRYNGNDYFYVKNAMNDIIAITDSNKNIVAEYRYDPWGKVLDEENLTAIGALNPFRYRSYYYDSDIKMYYLQSRYYDAEVGRFINCDDVNYIGVTGSEVSYNPFAYCENNPTNGFDPLGTVSAKDFLDVFKKCVDAIRDIIDYISDTYNKDLKALKSSIKLLSKKQRRTKKNIEALIAQCDSASNKLGKLGRFITAATFIYIISSTIKYPSEYPKLLTTFLIEKILDLFVYGTTEIVKHLPRTIPGVGYLTGVICSIVAELVMSAYFTENRINKITQTFIPYFKKISGKISAKKILTTGFKSIYS